MVTGRDLGGGQLEGIARLQRGQLFQRELQLSQIERHTHRQLIDQLSHVGDGGLSGSGSGFSG